MRQLALVMLWLLLPCLAFSPLVQLPPPAAAATISRAATSPVTTPKPDCHRRCGDVDIPYPFGLSNDCSLGDGEFTVTCNSSFNPPKPFTGDLEISSISLEAGELNVFALVSYTCYNGEAVSTEMSLAGTPFLVSEIRNEFTAIGCNTLAKLEGGSDWSYYTGCITYCESLDEAANDGDECTGLGCCQTSISGSLDLVQVDWNNGTANGNAAASYSPCSLAFVAEKGWYNFSRNHLTLDGFNAFTTRYGKGLNTSVPLVLDWALRNKDKYGLCHLSADKASAEPTALACLSTNSYCVNTTQVPADYLCNCSLGYAGNPYIANGCTNINECDLRKSNPAKYQKQYPCGTGSTCHDTEGAYTCKCNFGRRGDGKSDKGCQPIFPGYAIAILATFFASILACCMVMELKKRKQKHFFDKNGGEILKRMGINIFTERQLKSITNRYSTPIGEGSFGKVFMGIIDATQRVAVKCATVKGEVLPQEEFVNEITFQFRISHVNLVRLVGCCLETNVPMLVFEFVSKGSLYSVLHGANKALELSLSSRLDIAIGSAEAIAYMHSHSGHNHVHGDIKSGNILLDDDLMPKVSDFGSSKLVSIASKYPKWCVSGDLSYIDPVYIKCGRFTVKSDVYSFGVVLLELITRMTAKYGDNNSLPIDFVKSCKDQGNGRRMYDSGIFCDNAQYHSYMECLDKIGALAVRCLKEDVDDRPIMAEVVDELKQVKLTACGGP